MYVCDTTAAMFCLIFQRKCHRRFTISEVGQAWGDNYFKEGPSTEAQEKVCQVGIFSSSTFAINTDAGFQKHC